MAAVTKLDISKQVIFNETVSNKPPVPSRPVSGKFHNRGSGKLFPSTAQNRIFSDATSTNNGNQNSTRAECSALVIHPAFAPESDNSASNTPRSVPSYQRRTQSAKAKRTSPTKEQRKTLSVRPKSAGSIRSYRSNETEKVKPAVIDITNEIMPDLFDIERDKLLALPDTRTCFAEGKPPMHFTFSRPSSAFYDHHTCDKKDQCSCKKEKLSKKQQKSLKPSVYGLERQRHVYGSAPDLSSIVDTCPQFPYKTDSPPQAEVKQKQEQSNCSFPDTLEPLLPWLQKDVPEEVIGLDPNQCLVFLSPVDWSELPEVPDPLDGEEDLPYIKDVTTPKKWNPKKYGHPFNKQPVEEWVCKHKSYTTENGPSPHKLNTIYRQTIRLPRMRTADVVRKEITELEDVLKGIGTMDTDCGIVQYQEEITHFRELLDVTLNMIPERLKKVPEPEDMFGLRKMCEDHDLIIKNIKERVRECRMELAELEIEAGIQTDRQYFRKRANSLS